ncbi:MAG: 3-hydroxyacyl-CoA dehydrogenase family protein [Gemmatimonadetes bacterium]|nr:3-hydroxyacyl-CoA dehydrogenase family protein [Gemmatimonadota bacterium]
MTLHFQRVTVLGAGTRGHGIAQVCAMAGIDTVLYDVDLAAVDTGLQSIRKDLDRAVSLGRLTEPERDEVLGRIGRSSDLALAVQGAHLIIEAAPESMDIKRDLFRLLEQRVGEDTIFATNTSSLSISELAIGMDHPARFLGIHFFNPVHEIELVEVVWGEDTSEVTQTMVVEFVEAIGKHPILVRDSPGFASSRLGIVQSLEAIRMVEAGVTRPEDIDKAMVLGYGHPVGPLRLTDLIGLDVQIEAANYLHEALGSEAFRPPELLERMVAEGKLGKKSGMGFYSWDEGGASADGASADGASADGASADGASDEN